MDSESLDPERARARLATLSHLAAALHGESDFRRAQQWVTAALATLLQTDDTALCLFVRDGSPTWTINTEANTRLPTLGDPRTLPFLNRGFRDGSTVQVEDVARLDDTAVARTLPSGRLVIIPVTGEGGVLLGALLAAGDEPGGWDRLDLTAAEAVAAHLAVAYVNQQRLARLAEIEARGKEVVHQLQEAVRPPAPIVEATELGVHYVAADPSAPTGGDLYDWAVLPDGSLHLCVVDVMGKGVEATKHALAVTHAIRILAMEGCEIGELVARADALVTAQNPDLVATLVIVHYDPDTGRALLAGAGHPPPMLVHGDEVTEIATPGIPIGWPGAGSHTVVHVDLDRSDTLVLYTDGLIEATKNILEGLDQLAGSARATSSYPASSMARAVVERQLADAARRDDSLALVLRRRTPPSPDEARSPLGPFSHQFSPSAAAVPLARHLFRDWLERVPVADESLDTLLLVASELASNAVRHASGAPGAIQLRGFVDGDAVVIEVEDDGGALGPLPDWIEGELPDPDAEQGRGLFLVRELSDDVTTTVDGDRTIVRAVKRAVVATPVGLL